MKKHLRNWLGLFCFALLALWAAPLQAAGNTVLVLPFQVTAGPEMPDAARDVPQIIGTEMQQRGLAVIPMDKARSLLSSRGGSIDMAAARELGRKAGADLVLFGSFTQNGVGFSLQSLLVPVNEGQARPANFDRPSLLSLNECAAAMAGQASGMLAGAGAAARTEPTDPIGRADFVPMGTAKGALADVQVRGLQVMDPEVVLMRLSIRKGDTPSANDINEEVKRIWELGYFSDVQAHMEGNVLVFTVAEKPRIENIIVEGNHEIDAEDVIAAMGTKSGNVLNEQLIADDLQKINELYRKEGYYL
uniref:POTRA domain-containing protein n=1 Tax=uncultured Desulfovibrio sp. TaxID=167968 RepID=UPI00266EEB83